MLMSVDEQFDLKSVRTNCSVAVQDVFRFASQCACGLHDGRRRRHAGALQKSATRKLSLGNVCHRSASRMLNCLSRWAATNCGRSSIWILYIQPLAVCHPRERYIPPWVKQLRPLTSSNDNLLPVRLLAS